MVKRHSYVRSFAVALAVVISLALVSLCAFIPSKRAGAEQAENDIYANVSAIYNIGDESIVGKYGAYSVVDGKQDTYGYYTQTYVNGIRTYTYTDHAVGWVKAVNELAIQDGVVLVNIMSDWTAQPAEFSGGYTTAFAAADFGSDLITNGFVPGFSQYGFLVVPSGANIRLNLNGAVLDRNLGNDLNGYAPIDGYGSVIAVDGGKLEIIDTNSEARHFDSDNSPIYYTRSISELKDVDGSLTPVYGPELEVVGGMITGAVNSNVGVAYSGAISVVGGGTLTIGGGTVYGNAAEIGAGIFIKSGTFYMNGGAVENNEIYGKEGYGIGVFVENGIFEMSAGEITHNVALNNCYGGGVCLSNSEFIMNGGSISNNAIASDLAFGSGVGMFGQSEFVMNNDAVVSYNMSGLSGAVLLDEDCSMTMNNNSVVIYNTAYNAGSNFTACGGAGIFSCGTLVMNDNSSVAYNVSEYNGGGIVLFNGGSAELNSGTVVRNSSLDCGGGLYIIGAEANIGENFDISYNNAVNGGGVYVDNGGKTAFDGGRIVYNTASGNGGGLGLSDGGEFDMNGGEIAYNAVKSENAAYGGGVYVGDGMFTLTNGEVSNNILNGSDPSAGGGVYVGSDGSVDMSGGKISNNVANKDGDGVYVCGGGRLCVSGNAAVCDNGATDFGSDLIDSVKTESEYSNVYLGSTTAALEINGKFEDGACVYVTPGGNSGAIASDFDKFNNDKNSAADYNYAADPAQYIFADDSGKTAVTVGGDVYLVEKSDVTVEVTYGNGAIEKTVTPIVSGTVVSGYYGVTFTKVDGYTATVKVTYESAENEYTVTSDKQAVTVSYGAKEIEFTVVISTELSADDVTIELLQPDSCDDNGVYTYEYSGAQITPAVKVGFGDIEFTENDYTVSYGANTAIGNGTVVITFDESECGYGGAITVNFNIDIIGGSFTVTWQYYSVDSGAWTDIVGDDDVRLVLTYIPGANGDQTEFIRARLEASAQSDTKITQYAYADGVTNYRTESGNDVISGYSIVFNDGGAVALRDADTYMLGLDGSDVLPIGAVKDATVTIAPYALPDHDGDRVLHAEIVGDSVFVYDGTGKTVEVYAELDGIALVENTDYYLEYENNIEFGIAATVRLVFSGNYSGETELKFTITQSDNYWDVYPNILRWEYGKFDAQYNIIFAKPMYLWAEESVHVSILDSDGNEIVIDGVSLTDIALTKNDDNAYGSEYYFTVADEKVIQIINTLDVGMYKLNAWVDETDSYDGIGSNIGPQDFYISQAINTWVVAPSITIWSAGKFDAEINMPTATPLFGEVRLRIVDAETGNDVYYDSAAGIDYLKIMPAGLYYMTATVSGNDNYSGITGWSTFFSVLNNSRVDYFVNEGGVPWWGVLLIVLGVLLVLAIVVIVLQKTGVFRILTSKMASAVRERTDADATIAAVRLVRKNEEAAKAASTATVTEEQQQKEKAKTEKKATALEKKALTPEEKAAALEKKAQAMRERAAALKAKAKTAEQKAAEMKMTPEEKAAAEAAQKAAAAQRAKAKTPEERADALEQKARQTEEHAETLRAKAEVMKSRASEMRDRAAKKVQDKEAAAADNNNDTETEE